MSVPFPPELNEEQLNEALDAYLEGIRLIQAEYSQERGIPLAHLDAETALHDVLGRTPSEAEVAAAKAFTQIAVRQWLSTPTGRQQLVAIWGMLTA